MTTSPAPILRPSGSRPAPRRGLWQLLPLLALLLLPVRAAEPPPAAEVKALSLNGEMTDDKARLVIEARLDGPRQSRETPLFSTVLHHSVRASLEKLSHSLRLQIDVIQGEPKEYSLVLSGDGDIRQVTGEGLRDWSVRQEAGGPRLLVLRAGWTNKPPTNWFVTITAETELKTLPAVTTPLSLAPLQPALSHGYLCVEWAPELDLRATNTSGVIPVEWSFLPPPMRAGAAPPEPEPLCFRFQGTAYSVPLVLTLADPESRLITITAPRLAGRLTNALASFTLKATARVRNPKGGSLELLSGGAALTSLTPHPDWRARFDRGRYLLVFDKPGDYPLDLAFNATVTQADGWKSVDFRIAPGALQPLTLQGLAADTQFQSTETTRPERSGELFTTYLPSSGRAKISWKETRREAEGRLFYSVEALTYVGVSPGLMSQWVSLDCSIMQGEMNQLVLRLSGTGEVTRVAGRPVLSWSESASSNAERRLTIRFNQPQKERCEIQLFLQTSLGGFPRTFEPVRVRPESATRYAGRFCVANSGAVRLEITQAAGLSQISPDQFPSVDAIESARAASTQRFVYRFSSEDHHLTIQADNVLPEVTVSEVLEYRLGDTELAIEAEIELDIREAPLRELALRVPKGFVVARINASGLNDYTLTDDPAKPEATLRLIYGQPVSGRQLVQLRLEQNKPRREDLWSLPRVEVLRAKSTRGYVGVSAAAGFRLTPGATDNLTEIANAFFPKKVPGLQSAFRITDPLWQAALKVERLPQSVQVDGFHLFSVGEGIAYGSSVLNYQISGAPLSVFHVELSAEYFNVEFTGKDIRSWQKTTNGAEIQLHTPVSGGYTLLATYERPFKAQGETLSFTGARPLEVQSDQGHILVISAYQFQVKPASISPGLMALEPGEVPSEYRLFFDAPILAAYRYTTRPFNLQLELSPLAQGETLAQIADRASLHTQISKEGQVVTTARYFVKNRGTPHLRCVLPADSQLWSATVNQAAVVPVTDAKGLLIPLSQRADPNAIQVIELKIASHSKNPGRVTASAPAVGAPVLLADWRLSPDTAQHLVYRSGSLTPAGGVADPTGFACLRELFRSDKSGAWMRALGALVGAGLALGIWRLTGRPGTWRNSPRHWSGAIAGTIAALCALAALFTLGQLARDHAQTPPSDIAFVAPVQQPGSALSVEVANLPDTPSVLGRVWQVWPAWIALAAWIFGALTSRSWLKPLAESLGWVLLSWAVLRRPDGAELFLYVLGVFLVLRLIIPGLMRLWRLPARPATPAAPSAPAAAITAALLLLAGAAAQADSPAPLRPALLKEPAIAEYVMTDIRVEDRVALAATRVHWTARKGQSIPVLFEPAILTGATYPTNSLKLIQTVTPGGQRCQLLAALQDGVFDVELRFQLRASAKDAETGFVLPLEPGLVNQATVLLPDLDVDVQSPLAVSVERETGPGGKGTLARLVLPPASEMWIGWKPRSRNTQLEKAVYYAEIAHLYVPSAGVVEGAHVVTIRPAQGQIAELTLTVPPGTTITDVLDPAASGKNADVKTARPAASKVALWRFDPDTRALRVSLNPPMSAEFTLWIRSQTATGPLPVEQTAGLLSVVGASAQPGSIGFATGSEVQLDQITADTFSAINLEDYSAAPLKLLQGQIPGLTLRRAYRYTEAKGTASFKASAVEPEVRVESQQTLSLGEDRVLLAATLEVEITRAGIFRLSFPLPSGLEVETLTGPALSHWTEQKTPEGRVITLHLKARTEGRQSFTMSLTGPGVRATRNWTVPRLALREASKQQGQLVIVPENGMRLQPGARDGLTPLDPQKSGVRQKGVLAFRLLQAQWSLALDLEQVAPWIHVNSLQHVTVNEGVIRVVANLQYQIENTGLKSLRVRLPARAESVQFKGQQIADFIKTDSPADGAMKSWEIKLNRRVLGPCLIQVSYQFPAGDTAGRADIQGVQAEGVNVQRGFLTVQAAGRLQVRAESVPAALQPSEWQSIPRALRQDLETAAANFTFGLVDSAFTLPLLVERREAAKLLPARVNSVILTSVVSDQGVMLTQARLEIIPGDKRLLQVGLPPQARFWFAFVNQNGVWPWIAQDQFLLPLEQQSKSGQTIQVEFFYSAQSGSSRPSALDLELLGPKFDLPLENITWRVFLNEKWELTRWSGSLQLDGAPRIMPVAEASPEIYLRREASLNQEMTKEAGQWLEKANSLLEQGDPQRARQAFQAAYGLSQHDSAFNEDARVQLHNLKLQQALVGLNVRQSAAAGDTADALSGKLRDLRARKDPAYTQDEARQIIERNPAEDNAALSKLAERLIQQQDAAVSSPGVIRASIPAQGRLLIFKRAVQVDKMAELRLELHATAARGASWFLRISLLAGLFVLLPLLAWAARGSRQAR